MRNAVRLTVGMLALSGMLLAGRAEATSGNGPYYAEPSWDQKLACTTTANCPRFIVLTDWNSEAVLDRETGLVWEQAPDTTTRNWFQAIDHCAGRGVGGRIGWHLPLKEQLASLVNRSNATPALPTGHPFANVQSQTGYWSATSFANQAAAYLVSFLGNGGVLSTGKSGIGGTGGLLAWCVRGGQSFDGNTHDTLH